MTSLFLSINQDALAKSLNILWQGMLAVLVVVCIIMLVTYAMQYVSKKSAEAKDKKNLPLDGNDESKTLDN